MASQGDDCYFYYYSTCAKGNSCPFRHCLEAIGNEVVCELWREGRCFRTGCSYRHMELEKNRSAIACYWENQPSGCLKQHCPFLHLRKRTGNNSLTDVKNVFSSSVSSKVVPFTPVVEPVVVNPQDDIDDTSSVEMSPVKKISYSSKTLRMLPKEESTKVENLPSDAPSFGVKTLYQWRSNNKNDREATTIQGEADNADLRPVKLSNQRNVISFRKVHCSNEEDMSTGINKPEEEQTNKPASTRNFKPSTRILIKSDTSTTYGSDDQILIGKSLSDRIGMKKSPADVLSSINDAHVKSLEQIRQERRLQIGAASSNSFDNKDHTVVKSLSERLGMKETNKYVLDKSDGVLSSINDAHVKSLEQIRQRRLQIGAASSNSFENKDHTVVKCLSERLGMKENNKCVLDKGDGGNRGIKSLEQIRKERRIRIGTATTADNPCLEDSKTLVVKRLSDRLGMKQNKNYILEREDGVKSLKQLRQERRKRVEPTSEGNLEVKTLAQIRKERLEQTTESASSTERKMKSEISLVKVRREQTSTKQEEKTQEVEESKEKTLDQIPGESETETSVSEDDDTCVKNLEHIHRERIARRLGLLGEKELLVNHPGAWGDGGRTGKDEEPGLKKETSILSRLGPVVGAVIEKGDARKITTKQSKDDQKRDNSSPQGNVGMVRAKVSHHEEGPAVVLPKRRRITVLTETMDKRQSEEEDGSKKVENEKHEDGERKEENEDDSEEDEFMAWRRKRLGNQEKSENPPKKITINRGNEGTNRNPTKRRAERQIYQPPAAKIRGTDRSLHSRLGQRDPQDDKEENESMEQNRATSEETTARNSSLKRPRITFHDDTKSGDTSPNNFGQKVMKLGTTSEDEGKRAFGSKDDDEADVLIIKSSMDEKSEDIDPPKVSSRRRKFGIGLRERLLQQKQKFAVGEALEDTMIKKTSIPAMAVAPVTAFGMKETIKIVDNKTIFGGENKISLREHQIVSSTGNKDEISEEMEDGGVANVQDITDVKDETENPSSTSTGNKDEKSENGEGVELVLVPNGGVMPEVEGHLENEDPSSTSGEVLMSDSNTASPDSTNQNIPSIAVHPAIIGNQNQLRDDKISEKINVEGKSRRESIESKRKMSITDDDLLKDLDDGDDDGPYDDDDALLEEIENLING